MDIYFWLTYMGLILFIIYSGFLVNYYNNIAETKMKKGINFCMQKHIKPTEITVYQNISLILLVFSVTAFVLKINHDAFASCNYTKGRASNFLERLTKNNDFWWSFLIVTIYSISIYELAVIDKFKDCTEPETKNGFLLGINATVVSIISLMIIVFFYYNFIIGKPVPFIGKDPSHQTASTF